MTIEARRDPPDARQARRFGRMSESAARRVGTSSWTRIRHFASGPSRFRDCVKRQWNGPDVPLPLGAASGTA